ncbi:MAG: GntR family transcriptional regulator [Clostridia bacterium]|nr:GntR family transcriptional regulator [Clostridia bacterium]
MEERIRVTGSRYQQIAADIAAKIVDHQYQIGDKIYARSLIASQYSVSSETARKAVAILTDLNIVDTVKGSGVVIKSYDNAVTFLARFRDVGTMAEFKQDAMDCLTRLTKDGNDLRDAITRLVDHADRFRALNPLAPFSALIEQGALCIGQSLGSLNFWQNTSATVVAIRRGDTMILSPGPYAEFLAGDMIFFIGEEDCVERVSMFLREPIVSV